MKKPTMPGDILDSKYITPKGWTQKEVADMIGCDIKVVNRIVNGRQSISPIMAIKLGKLTQTNPEFWLGLQNKVDIFEAEKRMRRKD